MKTALTAVTLLLFSAAALADRYGVWEPFEDVAPFPSWVWPVLVIAALVYMIYQEQKHSRTEREAFDRAYEISGEARRSEQHLADLLVRQQKESDVVWHELAQLRNAIFDNMNDAPPGSGLRTAIDKHFAKYPHVLSQSSGA